MIIYELENGIVTAIFEGDSPESFLKLDGDYVYDPTEVKDIGDVWKVVKAKKSGE